MRSINIIAYHVFIVDKQIVVAVATIPVFFAEACRHIAIVPWLTPKRSVITAKIKATSGKTLFVLHCLSETLHRCRPTISFDSGKPNTFAVNACSCRDMVLVKGFIQIRICDVTKPGVCMCGKPGKFLIFQNEFPVRIRLLFLRGIVYLLDA